METITLDELSGVMSMQDIIDMTDDTGLGVVGTVALDEAYSSAVKDLELYAGRYYNLPLPAVSMVKEFHRQLTKCHLYFRRGAYPKEVMDLYKSLERKMRDLGPFSLGISGVEPASGLENAGVSVFAPPQRFMTGFMGLDV